LLSAPGKDSDRCGRGLTAGGNNVFNIDGIYGLSGSFLSDLFCLLLFSPPFRKDMIYNDNLAFFSRKIRSNAFI